jgi:hypothetical protein
MPILARDAAKYVEAIQCIFAYAETRCADIPLALASLSIVKGLAGKCCDRNDDWVGIHFAFGELSRINLRNWRHDFSLARGLLKAGQKEAALKSLHQLRTTRFWRMLQGLQKAVSESTQKK